MDDYGSLSVIFSPMVNQGRTIRIDGADEEELFAQVHEINNEGQASFLNIKSGNYGIYTWNDEDEDIEQEEGWKYQGITTVFPNKESKYEIL